MSIRPFRLSDAEPYAALLVENRAFLKPFEPTRPDWYFTVDGQRRVIGQSDATASLRAFAIIERASGAIVGRLELSGITGEPAVGAHLGYWVAREANRRGYATDAVGQTLDVAFGRLRLHRVQAAVMPRNRASQRVLEKNGFRREGLAERYLRIDGRWEDHVIFALTAEERERSGLEPRQPSG